MGRRNRNGIETVTAEIAESQNKLLLDKAMQSVVNFQALPKQLTPPSEWRQNKKRLRCGKTYFAKINSAPSQLNRDDHITNNVSVSVGGSTHASVWFYHL
jgi:hypothetical protein